MISAYRMAHQLGVARCVVELARQRGGYSDEELQELFLMGYLHDVGYEFTEDSTEHAAVGGEVLARAGFEYWREVAYHGMPDCPYASPELDILNAADMHTSPVGEPVSYEERLQGIRDRYGEDAPHCANAAAVIEELRRKGWE